MKKFTIGMLAILMFAGCSAPAEQPEVAQTDLQQEQQESGSHYPVTITTYNYAGDPVETVYEKSPEKVVAVYQGSVETMLELGLEDKVVAAFRLDNPVSDELEEAFSTLNYVEDVYYPDKEYMTMLNPDMIFTWGSNFADTKLGEVDAWIEKGINTYINSNTRIGEHEKTLENEYEDILNIGNIFDVEEKAREIVDEMKVRIDEILENIPDGDKVKVAVVEPMEGEIYNYDTTSLGGNMVEALGGEIVTPQARTIGKEDVVAANPDVMFVVYLPNDADSAQEVIDYQMNYFLEDPAFSSVNAVQNGRIYPIMLGDMYASGVRTLDGLNVFAQGMYGN